MPKILDMSNLKLNTLLRRFFNWLQMPVPRWRPAVAVILLFAIITSLLVYGGKPGLAATYTFNQTDWSGGQDAGTLAHPTNQTGWNKYSAQTSADTTGTVGSIKSTGSSANATENFSTTTYKDSGATTALWAGGFGQYRTITIDRTKVPSSQSNFPILVSGTYSYLATIANGGLVQNANGYDIGFYSSSTCVTGKLSWETESYNATTGAVIYWVKNTVSSASDTVFYMCYGNPTITTDQSSTGTWVSYGGVWHMDNASSTATDSTSNANTATQFNGVTFGAAGQISSAITLDGVDDYLNIPHASSITPASSFTLEAWIKNSSASTEKSIFTKFAAGGAYPGYLFSLGVVTAGKPSFWVGGGSWANATTAVNDNTWHHIAVTRSGTTLTFYKDGVADGTHTQTASLSNTVAASIGRRYDTGQYFPGSIDELRLSTVARSAAFMTAQYNNQTIPDKATDATNGFYTIGSAVAITNTIHGIPYRSITIDYTKVPSTQANFPVLVSGTYTYLKTVANGGMVQNASGYDIGFYTNSNCSTGKMTWETERYTATSGAVSYWVLVTSLSSSADTVFYMCYGNPAITTDQSATTSVWDANYKGVWHFNSVDTDSTSNALNFGTPVGSTSYTTGKIANTRYFVSTNAELSTASASVLDNDVHTIDFWFYMYPSAAGYYQVLDFRPSGSDRSPGIWTYPSLNCLHWRYDTGNTGVNCGGPTGDSTYFTNYTWYHVVGVKNGASFTMYVNGSQGSTATVTNPKAAGNAVLELGAGISSSANYFIDELKISNTNRSANWIATEYNSQNIPDKATDATNGFYTVGSETYTGVTAQSIKVNSGTDPVGTVTLTGTDTPGAGTVTYSVSNDGGVNFFQVTSGSPYTFASAGNGDLRWKVVLTGNATVSNITLSGSGYITSVTLTSNAYNTGNDLSIVGKLAWTVTGETATELAKLQVRTSPDGSTWSGWCGAADTGSTCTGSNYFLTANNNVAIASTNPLLNGGNDRWFQYLVTLVSNGSATASLNDLTITYVVNVAPEFNSSGGLTVSQITDSTNANYGKVQIDYSIRDSDTSTGTTNPGFVTPSFEYNIGGSWVAITSGNLSANATANKAVEASNYTSYTAYWSAPTDIPTNYLITAQLRVTINDNEGANNTAVSTSSNFILDTKVPTLTTFLIDKTANILNLSLTDDTTLQYKLSNNADLSADGLNATSGAWQAAGGTTFVNTALAWTFAASPVNPTVYLQVRDLAGNVSSQTAVAPKITAQIQIQDISNAAASDYKEFVSWDLYAATSGATFANYKVYRSTDGSSFGPVSTITNATSNYYIDTTVSNGTTYYYKINATDSDTDIGDYTTIVSDLVDGQGGSDSVAPVITAVTVAEQQSTYATITWTTDELSNSKVGYSISPNNSFNSEITVNSYVTSHSVTITDLTPGTTYLFRAISTDVLGNIGTNDNSGAGYTITTVSGPLISNITETEVTGDSATIAWNTDKASDSYVSYSVSSSLLNPTRVGTATLVSSPFRHVVTLPSLTAGVKYYYFVESTDASSNYSKDTNSGNYYSFTTTSDSKAPVISAVSAPIVVPTAAVIVWTTDEPATTQLSYGRISGVYPVTTTLDSTLTTYHVVSITGLREVTKYYYRVKSTDDAGNQATSSESDFTTSENRILVINIFSSGGKTITTTTVLDTIAPVVTNITTSEIGAFSATVSFNTNEDAIGLVRYYPANDTTKNHTSADYTYGKTHSVTLNGLVLGTDYEFEVKATDKFGNISTSDKQKFTSLLFTDSRANITVKDAAAFQKEVDDAIQSALPSLAPPFIEQPQVTDITDSVATVTWRTNIKAYSVASYASEEEYDQSKDDPYTVEVLDTSAKSLDHELNLQNLKPNTRYHLQVKSFTLPEVVGKSDDLTFVTKALKVQANIASITNSSFRAVWSTSDPTTSVVEYRNVRTGEVNQKSSETKQTSHDILVDNLTPGTPYDVKIFGYNEKGNKIETASAVRISTSVDTSTPQITALRIDSALIPGTTGKTQTIVSWKTDEPANSTVYFKEGSSAPGEKLTNKVELTNSFVTDHAIVISTLKSGGLYSIQVASTDQAGNQTLFPTRTIVVPRQSESVIDVIFKNFEDTFQFLKR